MPLRKDVDWHFDAVRYVTHALQSSRSFALSVARSTAIERGMFASYVPEGREVKEFRYGGGASVTECVAEIVKLCGDFLSTSGRIAVFEHHLLDVMDRRTYLKGECRLTSDSVLQVAFSGAISSELTEIVREWNVVPVFNAFLCEIGEAGVSSVRHSGDSSLIDVSVVSQKIQQMIVGAYDGEGFVFWRAQG